MFQACLQAHAVARALVHLATDFAFSAMHATPSSAASVDCRCTRSKRTRRRQRQSHVLIVELDNGTRKHSRLIKSSVNHQLPSTHALNVTTVSSIHQSHRSSPIIAITKNNKRTKKLRKLSAKNAPCAQKYFHRIKHLLNTSSPISRFPVQHVIVASRNSMPCLTTCLLILAHRASRVQSVRRPSSAAALN